MTVLQSLDRYYGRMAARGEVVNPGWSLEPIGYVILLKLDGSIADVIPWLDPTTKKPRQQLVPKWFGRSGIGSTPFFLWDNTAYALGVSDKDPVKTGRDHAAFKKMHLAVLGDTNDEGLRAFCGFIQAWDFKHFLPPHFSEKMFKANVGFRLDGDSGLLQDRSAAVDLVERLRLPVGDRQKFPVTTAMCLVRGEVLPIARLHRKIKGVDGTASAEVPLVSFEADAFKSYKKERGDNAPTSETAVFRYSAALNSLLDRAASRNRIKIGDATVAFWADASDEAAAVAAEDIFLSSFDPPKSDSTDQNLERDAQEAAKLHDQLEKVANGRPEEADPRLRTGTRFHVLGLAPNAARLSVRYWLDDDFSRFAKNLAAHAADMRIEPLPYRWGAAPSVARLLVKTTSLQEKFDNIPPQLAGEVTRAVLEGTRYPWTWLAAAIMRLRAGDDPGTGWHAAIIRAVLERDRRLRSDNDLSKDKREVPLSLDRARADDPAYHLGRLFAALETAQRLALGRVNATIRDRYFGAASATPAGVFPLLLRGVQNHVGKLRKERKEGWIEGEIGDIVAQLPPELPRSLKLEAQGRFAIGYYHQRQAQFAGRPKLADDIAAADEAIEE